MSTTSAENNKRIAKNTLLLYCRMLLTMVVSLYTSRVVLDALGVEDYGIYNVVGGVIIMFTFVNNAMVTSTQRFLSFEIGRKDYDRAKQIFSACINIHLVIAICTLIVAETVGLWFLNTSINVPTGREEATNWVYQLTVVATCINMLRMPYNAAIIAFERMSFFAYISIIENIGKLVIVYLLIWSPFDRLVFYAVLMKIVVLLVTLSYYIYCRRNFSICHYQSVKEKDIYRDLVSFSGWSLFGGLANMGASQGLNVLMNIFYGVTVNAAMGIANQVNSAIYSFVSSFQTAFNPQIVKSYAAGDKSYFINLIVKTSKYSYYLLFTLSLPVLICCEECLSLWLTQVPDYSVSFCRLMIVFSLLDAIQGPLWVSVQATGKIRNYQIIMSLMIMMNVPVSYCVLKYGMQLETVLFVKITINALILVVRLWYLNRLYKFPIMQYIKEVLFRATIVTIIVYLLTFFLPSKERRILSIVYTTLYTLVCNILLVYSIGLTEGERIIVKKQIKRII